MVKKKKKTRMETTKKIKQLILQLVQAHFIHLFSICFLFDGLQIKLLPLILCKNIDAKHGLHVLCHQAGGLHCFTIWPGAF